MSTNPADPQPVVVSLEDLESGNITSEQLDEAFGPASLGIILVKGLPASYPDLRRRLLSLSSDLAALPPSELAKLEDPTSHYLVGWSLGKETLKSGQYDTHKGSFYANPVINEAASHRARELYPNLPEYNAENIWPSDAVLPGFRAAFLDLCNLIVSVAGLVARACDRYGAANVEGYRAGYLERVVASSVATKARLLHYFPPPPSSAPAPAGTDMQADGDDDDWCATHVDHSCLTGLTSAMFVDESALSPSELDRSPDPAAGLYIHSRAGNVTKVAIPRDCLGFQTGEALERITAGRFRAVPHFVRGVGGGGGRIARNTLAVFTQPDLWEVVDEATGLDFAGFARQIVERNH